MKTCQECRWGCGRPARTFRTFLPQSIMVTLKLNCQAMCGWDAHTPNGRPDSFSPSEFELYSKIKVSLF